MRMRKFANLFVGSDNQRSRNARQGSATRGGTWRAERTSLGMTPLDIMQEVPDLCRPGPSLWRPAVTIRSVDRVRGNMVMSSAVCSVTFLPQRVVDPRFERGCEIARGCVADMAGETDVPPVHAACVPGESPGLADGARQPGRVADKPVRGGHAAGEPLRSGANHPRRVGVAAESGQLGEAVGRCGEVIHVDQPWPMDCLMKFCEINDASTQTRP